MLRKARRSVKFSRSAPKRQEQDAGAAIIGDISLGIFDISFGRKR
jgi:hypothetical protein